MSSLHDSQANRDLDNWREDKDGWTDLLSLKIRASTVLISRCDERGYADMDIYLEQSFVQIRSRCLLHNRLVALANERWFSYRKRG